MKNKKSVAKTLSVFEVINKFPTEQHARKYLEEKLWNNKPNCPTCKNSKKGRIYKNPTREGYYRCKDCRKMFSVMVGTIFESSKVDLRKWIYAIYLVLTSRKGISSLQLSKEIGVRQGTAWFLLQRIREACKMGDLPLLSGIVEVDEAYIGGVRKLDKNSLETWYNQKGVVLGMKSRDTKEVRMQKITRTRKKDILPIIKGNVKIGATLFTDENRVYDGFIKEGYNRIKCNHSVSEYVNKMASTNGIRKYVGYIKKRLSRDLSPFFKETFTKIY